MKNALILFSLLSAQSLWSHDSGSEHTHAPLPAVPEDYGGSVAPYDQHSFVNLAARLQRSDLSMNTEEAETSACQLIEFYKRHLTRREPLDHAQFERVAKEILQRYRYGYDSVSRHGLSLPMEWIRAKTFYNNQKDTPRYNNPHSVSHPWPLQGSVPDPRWSRFATNEASSSMQALAFLLSIMPYFRPDEDRPTEAEFQHGLDYDDRDYLDDEAFMKQYVFTCREPSFILKLRLMEKNRYFVTHDWEYENSKEAEESVTPPKIIERICTAQEQAEKLREYRDWFEWDVLLARALRRSLKIPDPGFVGTPEEDRLYALDQKGAKRIPVPPMGAMFAKLEEMKTEYIKRLPQVNDLRPEKFSETIFQRVLFSSEGGLGVLYINSRLWSDQFLTPELQVSFKDLFTVWDLTKDLGAESYGVRISEEQYQWVVKLAFADPSGYYMRSAMKIAAMMEAVGPRQDSLVYSELTHYHELKKKVQAEGSFVQKWTFADFEYAMWLKTHTAMRGGVRRIDTVRELGSGREFTTVAEPLASSYFAEVQQNLEWRLHLRAEDKGSPEERAWRAFSLFPLNVSAKLRRWMLPELKKTFSEMPAGWMRDTLVKDFIRSYFDGPIESPTYLMEDIFTWDREAADCVLELATHIDGLYQWGPGFPPRQVPPFSDFYNLERLKILLKNSDHLFKGTPGHYRTYLDAPDGFNWRDNYKKLRETLP